MDLFQGGGRQWLCLEGISKVEHYTRTFKESGKTDKVSPPGYFFHNSYIHIFPTDVLEKYHIFSSHSNFFTSSFI